MPNVVFNYPLDLAAVNNANKVINEEYTIGLLRNRIFVSRGGPFFGNHTTLIDLEENRQLLPNDDYKLLHYYEEASDRANQPVYAVVQIVNPEVSTRIGFTTHYIGGEFSYSNFALKEAILQLERDERTVSWGEVVGTPSEWNPTPHLHDIRNTYNWKSVIDSIMDVEEAILTGDNASDVLLLETIDIKMDFIDNLLLQYEANNNQFKSDVNATIGAMPGVMDDKIQTHRDALPEIRKPTLINSNSAVYLIPKKNITYILQPKAVSNTSTEYTVRLQSTLQLQNGDYIRLLPSRDWMDINIESIVGPIRRSVLGKIDAVNNLSLRLDKTGILLVWDTRVNAWDLATDLDPERVKFDKYDLREVTTTGDLDFSQANTFLLSSGNNRMISFKNLPANRNITAVINVVGNGTILWPTIKWADGATPVLSDTNTIVTLYRTNNIWVGSWQAL